MILKIIFIFQNNRKDNLNEIYIFNIYICIN